MSFWIGLIAGLMAGVVAGVAIRTRGRLPRLAGFRRRASRMPTSMEHVLDLMRRAHGAKVAVLVSRHREPVIVPADAGEGSAVVERAVATARLGLGDGREHVVREDGEVTVAVGDRKLGVAMILPGTSDTDAVSTTAGEIRRLLGELEVDLSRGVIPQSAPVRVGVDLPPGLDTLPGLAHGLCDRARIITGRPTAVVARDPVTQSATVVALSRNADRRLMGSTVTSDSAVGRACLGEGSVTTGVNEELFGRAPGNRRRRAEEGTAYPLRDGRHGVGALVVFGPPDLDPGVQERLLWLAVDAGPRFAAASAVSSAELRAITDSLTGLTNRSGLDRIMANAGEGPCAVLSVDLDHFKKVNDTLGHPAGDAALKHLAKIFRTVLRDSDVASRVGGEEFVLWLPGTARQDALEVAERVRKAVEGTEWLWAGNSLQLTCSIGVASRPETTSQIHNLVAAADAALYRAKKGGRNRVEEAYRSSS